VNPVSLRYAGFWARLGSLLLDGIILLPLMPLMLWGEYCRLFWLYYTIPDSLFRLFYSVYLVQRYGGTPGKLIMGIRIRKLNGDPVGYREALLRFFPDFIFGLLASTALIFAAFHISDAEYHSLSFHARNHLMHQLAPSWYKPLQRAAMLWTWSELIVLLMNQKRRALHDFIAGTVVVHMPKKTPPLPPATIPCVLG